jgi:hypothetical protein
MRSFDSVRLDGRQSIHLGEGSIKVRAKGGRNPEECRLRILKGRRNEAPPFPLPSRALRDLSGKRER